MINIQTRFPEVAIIADQMTAFGGADREMYSVLKIFPNADIYTILFDKEKYPFLKNTVHTSFVQRFYNLLPKKLARHFQVLKPFAYESFDLTPYDLVISISAGPGKAVITGLNQPHLALVMTPPRNLWDRELNVRGSKLKFFYKPISILLNNYLRIWDWTTSRRIDYWVANSEFVAKKIQKTYDKKASVIYPGVEDKYYKTTNKTFRKEIQEKYNLPEDFVLVVSRLYDYKRVDWAIRSCIQASKKLVIVGEGPDRGYLEKVANKNPNIVFLGFVDDDMEVKAMLKMAQVLLFCGVEDFGLVPVESMASGTPVFAYKEGGVLETIKEGVTGEFFTSEEQLTKLLLNTKKRYNREEIKKHAFKFSEEKFLNNLTKYIQKIYEEQER